MIRTVLIVAILAGSAWASPTLQFNFNDDHSGNAGTIPYGTVTLTDLGGGTVKVDVNLFNGLKFVATGFDGSFGFNLTSPAPNVTISNLTSGWSPLGTMSPGTFKFDGFGNFEYAMQCDDCGNGGSSPVPPPLSFEVTAAGLDTTSFEQQSSGGTDAYFVADVIGTKGKTGAIGATGLPIIVKAPEPSSFLLFGTTALAFLAFVWHRKKSSKGLIQK